MNNRFESNGANSPKLKSVALVFSARIKLVKLLPTTVAVAPVPTVTKPSR